MVFFFFREIRSKIRTSLGKIVDWPSSIVLTTTKSLLVWINSISSFLIIIHSLFDGIPCSKEGRGTVSSNYNSSNAINNSSNEHGCWDGLSRCDSKYLTRYVCNNNPCANLSLAMDSLVYKALHCFLSDEKLKSHTIFRLSKASQALWKTPFVPTFTER